MKKADWFLITSLFFIVWLCDYASKQWALENITQMSTRGPIGFVLHKNPGIMLGAFSNLSPILRVVSLSTTGAFLIFIFSATQYLLPQRSLLLRSGMSVLLGGIIGNVTDRILHGPVTDFVFIRLGNWASPIFNLGDALQWVGYLMILYNIIFHSEQIWPSKEGRKQIWVIPKFQIKYIAILIAAGIGFSLISGVFSYTFLKLTLTSPAETSAALGTITNMSNNLANKKALQAFVITFSLISLFYAIILFIVGRSISHRTAGPIYAFEKYIKDLLAGTDRKLQLRTNDELLHLVELADRIKPYLLKKKPSGDSSANEHQ